MKTIFRSQKYLSLIASVLFFSFIFFSPSSIAQTSIENAAGKSLFVHVGGCNFNINGQHYDSVDGCDAGHGLSKFFNILWDDGMNQTWCIRCPGVCREYTFPNKPVVHYPGDEICLECDPGYVRHNGVCVLSCPAGTIKIGDECLTCGAGQYLSGSTCTPCQAGRYQNSTSHVQTSCPCCAAGTYQDLTGQASCKTCPSNATCSGTCNTTFTCNTGYKKVGNTCVKDCPTNCDDCSDPLTCLTCAPGYFLHQGQCVLTCPTGFYHSGNQCLKCPCNTATCTHAGFTCPTYTYFDAVSNVCCPNNATCSGGSATCSYP